jgi:hypothetical protein
MPNKLVKISVDIENGEVLVAPERVVICQSKGEEVLWKCDDGRAFIHFPGDSPFHDGDFHAPHGGGVISGKAKPGSCRKDPYKYSVQVVVPGHGTFKKDPEVVVDP